MGKSAHCEVHQDTERTDGKPQVCPTELAGRYTQQAAKKLLPGFGRNDQWNNESANNDQRDPKNYFINLWTIHWYFLTMLEAKDAFDVV